MELNYASLLGFIFPPSRDEQKIAGRSAEEFIRKSDPRLVLDEVWALAPYKDGEIRAAIHLLKFHHHMHALHLLSSLLSHYLSTLPQEEHVIIPVPLSSKRFRERGFNQVEVLAHESIKDLTSFSVDTHVLIKKRHTTPQSSLNKKGRQHNVKDAFSLSGDILKRVKDKHVILLDDVVTTGSTLFEAKKALAHAGPCSITLVAIAH